MSATLEKSADSLLDQIREPHTPYLSPARFAKLAGLSVQSLAGITGVHRNTVSQHPESPKVQESLRAMLKVISAATEVTGDANRAICWFMNEPIADYRHQTAAELVAAGHVDAVMRLLEDLNNGATG